MQTEFQTYLQPVSGYFWQYESDGEVIAITEGATIAYVNYVKNVLEDLEAQGVPPFGSLLLVIATTNPDGLTNVKITEKRVRKFLEEISGEKAWLELLERAVWFLKMLCDLPKDYKTGAKRVLLFQTLFEDCHNSYSPKKAKKIIECFDDKTILITPIESGLRVRNTFYKDFQTLSLLQRKFPTVESILKAMTSVPDVEEEIPLPAPENLKDEPKDFVEQLTDNHQTFHVGALIKRIWSGIHIPSQNALPSSQPLGGESDLTNKGDFDRLLLSEFANEDAVFMSRLANNEALYIQREIPPTDDQLERIFLIDISLKNWGTPKTIAYAIMLAIANHPKSEMACSAYAVGKQYSPVPIETVDDIIEGLQLLDGGLSAHEGLQSFFSENPNAKNAEVFFVTEPSTIKKPEVLKTLNDYREVINYLIYTDVEGGVEVFKNRKGGKKHLQSIRLPLKELWKNPKRKTEPSKSHPELSSKYPMLFAASTKAKIVFAAPDGAIFSFTKNRNLLKLFDRSTRSHQRGWEIVYENIGFSTSDLAMGFTEEGDYLLLAYILHKKEIILLNIRTEERTVFPYENWKIGNRVTFEKGKFYHHNTNGSWSISIHGEVKEVAKIEPRLLRNRTTETNQLKSAYWSPRNVYRNIKEVSIHLERKTLVFGNIELILGYNDMIILSNRHQFSNNRSAAAMIPAKRIKQRSFEFSDGSRIEVKPFGLIVLISSHPEIPDIYVPSLIDNALGCVASNEFAGYDFFYKESLCEIYLEDFNGQETDVLRAYKDFSWFSMEESNERIVSLPGKFPHLMPFSKAKKLKNKLEDAGAEIRLNIVETNEPEIVKIASKAFFEKYINRFVQNILDHEA